MSKFIDITGQRFGRLVVVKRVGVSKHRESIWLCRCDCGKKTTVVNGHLKSGNTKSCGCLQRELSSIRKIKHGHTGKGQITKTYHSWAGMVKRCTNFNYSEYRYYGGRGITVCRRWRKFENFLEDMGEKPEGHQIDRIDNNGNYCKSNCRWVTSKQNNRNRRNNRLITYEGKEQCITAWAEEFNICAETLRSRLYRHGWSVEKALTTPIRKYRRKMNG